MSAMEDLLYLMQRLRDPESGCPWDRQQDFQSIVPHSLEECYELADTIERCDYPHLQEELGDVLFQVVFYSQLGVEQSLFDFESVARSLVDKLVRRHPHVFADGNLRGDAPPAQRDAAAVTETWESIKQLERQAKAKTGLLADIPLALPALTRAHKLQKRASRAGFDWTDISGVLSKLDEEVDELRHEIDTDNREGMVDEMGDLLFSVVNLARHLGIDPESALRQGNRKFEQRFERMEQQLVAQAATFKDLDAEQKDQLWRSAKRQT